MMLLKQFARFLEKQDMLSKLTENEALHSYSRSEIYVIAAIGDISSPNVSAIAQKLKMTKGAVSKITKKLCSYNVIEACTAPGNKQKIFFKLTASGAFLYEEHDKRSKLWLERDKKFLSQFSYQELQGISRFMSQYNQYLEEEISELEKAESKY